MASPAHDQEEGFGSAWSRFGWTLVAKVWWLLGVDGVGTKLAAGTGCWPLVATGVEF